MVEMMGGKIEIASQPGEGSTFTFKAIVSENRTPLSANKTDSQSVAELKIRPLKILIADDNETMRYLLDAMLTRWSHNTDQVKDGADAITAVNAGSYDVVFMDMQMPGVDGVEATRRIRSTGDAKSRIPIIALTADLVPEHHSAYLEAGANVVLAKPIEWLELARELNRLCGDVEPSGSHDGQDRLVTEPTDGRPLRDGEVLDPLKADIGVERVNAVLGKSAQ
jgi:CheY-like chemotaxis protein